MINSILYLPIFFILALFFLLYRTAYKRDKRNPIDDVAVVLFAFFIIYSLFPSIVWLFMDGSFGFQESDRLISLNVSESENFYLLSIAGCYVAGLSIAYFISQRKIPAPIGSSIYKYNDTSNKVYINKKVLHSCLILYAISYSIVLYLRFFVIGSGESYVDSYRIIASLPLAMRQFLKVLDALLSITNIVILVAILQRLPKSKLWLLLYISVLIGSFSSEGSRSFLFTGLLSLVIAWHMIVKPIKIWQALLFFVSGILLFLLFGVIRELGSSTGISANDFSLGEFGSLWANAIDLYRKKNEMISLDIPFAVYINEFIAFIPSQLLPFNKSPLSDWYLDSFYYDYKMAGGGWVFGAISQAIVGLGLLEAFIRGFFLGLISVWLTSWSRKINQVKWWALPVYLYIVVFSFQSVRDTTFRLFGDIIQNILPSILLIVLVASFLKKKG